MPGFAHYVFGLAVVGLLLFALHAISRAYGKRRFGGGPGDPIVRVARAAVLSAQTELYVVETSGRRYLIGGGAGRLALLADLSGGLAPDADVRNAR